MKSTIVANTPKRSYFLYAYSLYNDSPIYDLDQTSSYSAIEAMQTFLNRYPQSKNREEATRVLNELQLKLETKAFNDAELYFNLRYYKSAIVAFDEFRKNYPDSKRVEESFYYRVRSQYELAKQSVDNKKRERYQEAVQLYEQFIDLFPESDYAQLASDFYEESLDQIKRISSN